MKTSWMVLGMFVGILSHFTTLFELYVILEQLVIDLEEFFSREDK
jgi:hypothetical protein